MLSGDNELITVGRVVGDRIVDTDVGRLLRERRPPVWPADLSTVGCKAIRVKSPNEFKEAFSQARGLMQEHQVPVVLEFILERVTNIAMGTDIHNVTEFEDILCLDPSLTLDNVSGSVLQTKPGAAENAAPASTR